MTMSNDNREFDSNDPEQVLAGAEPVAGPDDEVVLQPWSENDLRLLEKLLGDPEMMMHLGGPESHEQILRRNRRYAQLSENGTDHMFKIVWGPRSEAVGSVGYWEKTWRGRLVYEMGWSVLPAFQGLGIATKAAEAVIARARLEPRHQFMHAFPSVTNPPSNAICRKLGFSLIEECEFEYPPGNILKVNDWRLDLYGTR
jgi:RimJ/RimL family protein N-acetyltransferase